MLGLKSEEQIVEGAKKGGNVVVGEVSGASADDGAANHDAIAMLEPPQEGGFSLRRLYIDLKYWLLDMIRPCRDPGMDMKVCCPHPQSHSHNPSSNCFRSTTMPLQQKLTTHQRFNIMMHAHNTGLEDIRRQLHPRKPWYLEVIAVRPLSHGKGLGRQMMRGIVGLAGDAPIVLECTDKSTVGFYQKFGFGVVQEMVLKDLERPEDDMVCWWMVRE